MNSNSALVELIKYILTGGGIAAIMEAYRQWRKSRKEDERTDVDILAILRQMAADEVKRVREDMATMREEAQRQSRAKDQKIDRLSEKVDALIDDRDGLVEYVKSIWRWLLSGAKPPPPPIPDHLQDVLPEAYHWPED